MMIDGKEATLPGQSTQYVNLGDEFWTKITHPSTGLVIGRSSTGNVELIADNNDNNSKWHFTRNSDGTYKIAAYCGEVMDVNNWGTSPGTNVSCVNPNGSTAQKWYILGENGNYTIKSTCAETVLDVASDHNIQMYTPNNTAAQKFAITKITPFNGWVKTTTGNGDMPIYSDDYTVFNFDATGATYFSLYLFYPDGHGEEIYTGTAKTFSKKLPAGDYSVQVSAQNNIGWTWDMGKISFRIVDASIALPKNAHIEADKLVVLENNDITFTFDAEGAYYYNLVLYKEDGTKEEIYAGYDRKIKKSFPAGKYKITLSALNNIGWLYETAKIEFSVICQSQKITFEKNGGTMDDTFYTSKVIDAINTERTPNTVVAYTSGDTTGTNQYGFEVIVNSDNLVTATNYYVGNSSIPSGGIVISGHGDNVTWLDKNIKIGNYVTLDTDNKTIHVYSAVAWKTINKMVDYGEKYGFLPTPEKEGYIFNGWYTSFSSGEKITEDTIVCATGNHTLYAHWSPTKIQTSTTVNDNLFTIKCTNIKNGDMVILSLYKNKQLIKIYNKVYQGDNITFIVTEDYDEAKVMVWKALSTLKPVTEVETVKN